MDGLCDNEALGTDMLETSHSSHITGRSIEPKRRNNFRGSFVSLFCPFVAVCRCFALLCSLCSFGTLLCPFLEILYIFSVPLQSFCMYVVIVPLELFCTIFSHFASLYVLSLCNYSAPPFSCFVPLYMAFISLWLFCIHVWLFGISL